MSRSCSIKRPLPQTCAIEIIAAKRTSNKRGLDKSKATYRSIILMVQHEPSKVYYKDNIIG